jgi:hypothetical protein
MSRLLLPLVLVLNSTNIFSLNPAKIRACLSPAIATGAALTLSYSALKPIIKTLKDGETIYQNNEYRMEKDQRTYLQSLKAAFHENFLSANPQYDLKKISIALVVGGLISVNGLYDMNRIRKS